MKNIICDECKRTVGMIEEETYTECDDRFYGVEILCKECKNKKPEDWWTYRGKDINIILYNQE